MLFLNRRAELASLRALLEDDQPKLALLYGRRRLGKTRLLARLLDDHDGLFLTMPEQTLAGILLHVQEEISRQTGRPLRIESVAQLLTDLPNHGRRLIVFDEVQRLFDAADDVASGFQEAWDHTLQASNLVVVLCGSVIGTLARLRDAKSPLYGRFAWHHHLEPFSYAAVRLFYPTADEADKVRRFSVFGATPHYHDLSRQTSGLAKAIRRFFLDVGAPLREEPRILFETELRRPERYLEILEAMAAGCRTVAEIADRYDQKSTDYTNYVQRLRADLRLVRSDDPVGGKKRKGRLAFTDPFFHFYYRFVYPNLPQLDLGAVDAVGKEIARGIESYHGKAFELVLREYLTHLNGGKLAGRPISFQQLGGWWDGQDELDAVALGRDTAIAAEAKFTARLVPADAVERLVRRARTFQDVTRRRHLVTVMATRSPLTANAQVLADKEEVVVVGLEAIGQALKETA